MPAINSDLIQSFNALLEPLALVSNRRQIIQKTVFVALAILVVYGIGMVDAQDVIRDVNRSGSFADCIQKVCRYIDRSVANDVYLRCRRACANRFPSESW